MITSECVLPQLKGERAMKIKFGDVPFIGDAIATLNGEVIWTNHESGDCPPDLCVMYYVESMYIVNNQFVFELTREGE